MKSPSAEVRVFDEQDEKCVTSAVSYETGVHLLRLAHARGYLWPNKRELTPDRLTLVYAESGRYASYVL